MRLLCQSEQEEDGMGFRLKVLRTVLIGNVQARITTLQGELDAMEAFYKAYRAVKAKLDKAIKKGGTISEGVFASNGYRDSTLKFEATLTLSHEQVKSILTEAEYELVTNKDRSYTTRQGYESMIRSCERDLALLELSADETITITTNSNFAQYV